MANSDWAREPKAKPKMSAEEAFSKYCWWASYSPVDHSQLRWRITDFCGNAACLVFLDRRDDAGNPYRAWVYSLASLESALMRNFCPVPHSLATILDALRKGENVAEAVNFYTQSGDVF